MTNYKIRNIIRIVVLVVFWLMGALVNVWAWGYKDFPESLRDNLFFLALDAGCWLVAFLTWWMGLRGEWQQWQTEPNAKSWEVRGQILLKHTPVFIFLVWGALDGLTLWTARIATEFSLLVMEAV